MPVSVLQINNLFNQLRSQLSDFKNQLILFSAASRANKNYFNFILNALNSFGLECREFGQAGISVDISGNKLNSNVLAVRVKKNDCINNIGYDGLQNSDISNESITTDGIIQAVIGLGLAKILSSLRDQMQSKVRIIFQSNEHDNFQNTDLMVQQGVLDQVAAIYGLNFHSTVPQDSVGIQFGPFISSNDDFTIKIFKRNNCDCFSVNVENIIQIAANIIIALKQTIARIIDPIKPVVISFSSIHSESDGFAVPCTVVIKGSFQTIDESVYNKIPAILEKTVQSITSASALDFQFETEKKSPILKADETATLNLFSAAKQIMGEDHVVNIEYPTMDKVALTPFLKIAPGSILYLGASPRNSNRSFNYTGNSDIVIEAGLKSLIWALLNFSHL